MKGFHCDNSKHRYSVPGTSSPLHYTPVPPSFCQFLLHLFFMDSSLPMRFPCHCTEMHFCGCFYGRGFGIAGQWFSRLCLTHWGYACFSDRDNLELPPSSFLFSVLFHMVLVLTHCKKCDAFLENYVFIWWLHDSVLILNA
jgi:hypothetical protein